MTSPSEELALLGMIKGVPVILGKKFVMQTLDSDQEAAAVSAVAVFDEDTKRRVLRIEKLARAISTIDGVPFSVTKEEQDKGETPLQKARKTIYKWQPPVVDRVYAEYEKLEKQRDDAVAEIEKNATSPVTSSGAGK
jgi:hypothetical protein